MMGMNEIIEQLITIPFYMWCTYGFIIMMFIAAFIVAFSWDVPQNKREDKHDDKR